MEQRLAKLISILLHPSIMPTIGGALILFADVYPNFLLSTSVRLIILSIVFIGTFLLPVLATLIMIKIGIIRSIELNTPEERRLPYLATTLFYFSTFYVLQNFPLHYSFLLMLLGANLGIILTMFINLFWKLSAHMVGIGGLVACALVLGINYQLDAFAPVVIALVLAGIIGSARLMLEAHTLWQIYAGFVVGFVSVFSTMNMFFVR